MSEFDGEEDPEVLQAVREDRSRSRERDGYIEVTASGRGGRGNIRSHSRGRDLELGRVPTVLEEQERMDIEDEELRLQELLRKRERDGPDQWVSTGRGEFSVSLVLWRVPRADHHLRQAAPATFSTRGVATRRMRGKTRFHNPQPDCIFHASPFITTPLFVRFNCACRKPVFSRERRARRNLCKFNSAVLYVLNRALSRTRPPADRLGLGLHRPFHTAPVTARALPSPAASTAVLIFCCPLFARSKASPDQFRVIFTLARFEDLDTAALLVPAISVQHGELAEQDQERSQSDQQGARWYVAAGPLRVSHQHRLSRCSRLAYR